MEQRTCSRCGECFAPRTHNQKYCSRQCCRVVANAKRRGTQVLPKHRDYYCAECGKHCVKGQDVVAHATKFCSPRCKKRHWYWRNRPVRTLVKSEGTATQILQWQSICALHTNEFWQVNYVGNCPECGNRWIGEQDNRIYCSGKCKRKAKSRRHRQRHGSSMKKARNRAKKHGVIYHPIKSEEVAKRDGHKCQQCGVLTRTDVDMSSHPHSRHVDHIVPISAGGSHAQWNLQILCRSCNLEKADTIPELYLWQMASAMARWFLFGSGTQGGDQRQKQRMTG